MPERKNMKFLKTLAASLAAVILLSSLLVGCDTKKKEKIVIYSSNEDYIVEYMEKRFKEEFPDYDIVIEYKSTGEHSAALKAAGTKTDCDITTDLEYGYAAQIAKLGYLADLTDISDFSIYTDDTVQSKYYIPELRNGGCIAVNLDRLEELGLDMPTSYEDLLDPQYKGQISMPNPASSGTGYMFLLSLVNAWGEEKALEYFDKLAVNIHSFTSSGAGPVSALALGEVTIALGMTSDAVTQINEGANLKIVFFEPGSPSSLYAQGIIAGKEDRQAVREVFDFLSTTLKEELRALYYPEKIYKDKDFKQEGFPEGYKYADMTVENAGEYKTELLAKWKH